MKAMMLGAAALGLMGLAAPARAQSSASAGSDPAEAAAPQAFAIHEQATFVLQGHDAFHSPYRGPQSLDPAARGNETADVGVYVGVTPWTGAEVWINPEVDQGFGLSDTIGIAGFPSGEAYKVGASTPYAKLQRVFLRQTIDLGGASQHVDADLNQFAQPQSANRLVLTVGKLSVVDIFDTNPYAHDPRGDFLNWSVIDAGTFDYAANAWGYTYGAVAELYLGRWAARGGAFDLTVVPNSVELDPTFRQFQLVGELEEDHQIAGQPGALKITGFLNRARMGLYQGAVRLAEETGALPNLAAVRQYRSRPGVSLDLQQQLASGLGAFLRAGWADGQVEPFEFTDIDDTLSGGLSLSGARWRRPDDVLGLAGVINQISKAHQQFLADGGLGIVVGDGRLPDPGPEKIVESYYSIAVIRQVRLSLDYQFVTNPGYDRLRGPISIGAVRLQGQF